MTTQDAHNDQLGHIIERIDTTLPLYFSLKIGRDFGSPTGGWTDDRNLATIMTKHNAEKRLETGLASQAPFCKVVPK